MTSSGGVMITNSCLFSRKVWRLLWRSSQGTRAHTHTIRCTNPLAWPCLLLAAGGPIGWFRWRPLPSSRWCIACTRLRQSCDVVMWCCRLQPWHHHHHHVVSWCNTWNRVGGVASLPQAPTVTLEPNHRWNQIIWGQSSLSLFWIKTTWQGIEGIFVWSTRH